MQAVLQMDGWICGVPAPLVHLLGRSSILGDRRCLRTEYKQNHAISINEGVSCKPHQQEGRIHCNALYCSAEHYNLGR